MIVLIIVWNDSIILAMLLTPVKWCGQMPNYSNPELIIVLLFRQLELSRCRSYVCLQWMTLHFGLVFISFSFFFERHPRRSAQSRVRFLLPLTNKAWISQHAWHSLQPVFPGVLKRPLSFPPRITEHKDTQSCRVIQFVLSSLPHRLFA